MSISKKLKEIKDFLESEKIGKIFIDKRPNGIILIETTETKKYQSRVCKKATWFQKFQITIEYNINSDVHKMMTVFINLRN